MAYPKFAVRIQNAGTDIDSLVARYSAMVDVVTPSTTPRVSRDPDDDHVLACAIAARAEFIVSGDKDLLVLERFEGIAIVSAAQALAMIEAAGS